MSSQRLVTMVSQPQVIGVVQETQAFTVVDPPREQLSAPNPNRVTEIIMTGAPGPPGAAGVNAPVAFPFTNAATWTVRHGLHRYPQLELVDTEGNTFEADVEFPDPDTAVVTLAAPLSGFAIVS